MMVDETALEDALATGVCLGLPAVSVAIANASGLIWSGTNGFSNVEQGRLLTQDYDDLFCVGSITKTFVAVVILQLVDEDKVHLDKTAMDYLAVPVAGGDEESTAAEHLSLLERVPNIHTATIRHLLSHQSGIPTWEFEPSWIRAGRGADIVRDKVWHKTETLKYVVDSSPSGKPGERFSYSNTNYTILGLVVESVTGNSAASEIRRRILQPLNLSTAYLESFETPATSGRQLPNHYHFATRAFIDSAGLSDLFVRGSSHNRYLINTSAANLSTEWTAGGMVMSMKDLALYGRALRDGTLLSDQMVTEMFTYYPPSCDEIGDDSSGAQGKSLQESGERYCQGICHTIDVQNGEYYGHGGLTLGFCSRLLWLKDLDVVVACATNVGLMHSGFAEGKSPWELFVSSVLLPVIKQQLLARKGATSEQP